MRKADRLFQIIQILRRSSRPVTSAQIAEELEVARRTVYRDIAHLIGQRVPIEGEAGFGYVLDPRYEMPPLMLTPDEIEAVVLGIQMVGRLGDPAIGLAASDVMSKIASVVPPDLLPYFSEPAVGLKPDDGMKPPAFDTRPLRLAIREGRKIALDYRAENSVVTSRIVWPVLVGYAESHGLLIAWCETRQSFRHFRTDRIIDAVVLDDVIGISRSRLRQQWQRWREGELSRAKPQ